ncbi:MAG TPA: DUF1648 domain-containing protein [Candidatus Obscuribacterales bacterium]
MSESTIKSMTVIALAAVAAGPSYIGMHWGLLPDKVPIHFGLLGEADNWGPRITVLIGPAVSIFLFVMLTIGGRSSKGSQPDARQLLAVYRLVMGLMLSYMQAATVNVALGRASGLGAWFAPAFLVAVFAPLGFYHLTGKKLPKK